ncbi:MAG TPA: patatin-like phospholipase family protein [Candidatus Krumholzibacteria bacterium]|nr:patatin-like phospholipase family protein [Candidatus Krumholzibacteria bacterium]
MSDLPRPTLGLALSGGTAKSIAHIGVLQAIEEAGLRPDVIAGTSGGSLIAVVYASGVGTDRMVEMAGRVNWRRLARVRIPRLGLFSNQGVAELVRDTVGDLTFEDLEIPTHVVTTDLLSGGKAVFSHGPVAPAVQASCSIPQIFSPVEIGDGLYADGGFLEYLPLPTLRDIGCTTMVGVHLGSFADFTPRPGHLLAMIMRTIGIVAVRNAREAVPLADVLIEPDLRGFHSFDLKRHEELIEVGYRAGTAAVPHILAALDRRPSPIPWPDRLRTRLLGWWTEARRRTA